MVHNTKTMLQRTIILVIAIILTTNIPLSTSATGENTAPYERIKIIDPPEPNENGFFGIDIAMSKDRIIIGEEGASKAHIYDGKGELIRTLRSPTGEAKSSFGSSVAIFGDYIVVGESNATVNGVSGAGKIHFFDYSGNNIKSIQIPQPQPMGGFGFSMATDGEKLVVGEPGPFLSDVNTTCRVHILDKSGAFILSYDRPQPRAGHYGWSVGVHGNVLVVGEPYAWHSSGSGYTRGIIHIYTVNETGRLMSFGSPIGRGFGNFGYSVAVGDDVIAVGEVRGDANSTSMAGMTHLYSTNGTLIRTLYPVIPKVYGYYGVKVFVSDKYVAVNQRGYIYLYDHLGNHDFTVSEENLVSAAFGYDVVIDGNRLAAGAISALVGGKQCAGEVYLYNLRLVEPDDVGGNMFMTVEMFLVLSIVILLITVAATWRARIRRNSTIIAGATM